MSGPMVVVVATIVAHEGEGVTVEKALQEAVVATLKEPGCIQYTLHRKIDAPHVFVMFEQWADDAALEAHSKAPGFQALGQKIDGRADLVVDKLAQIS